MSASAARPRKPKSLHPFRDNTEVVVFAIVMALGLKVFALEAYQIPTGSMQPNLMGTALLAKDGSAVDGGIHDRVLVDKLTYLLRDPQRWEVVVFRYPLVTHNNYVKRLVGMPGEELLIQHGDIYTRPLGSEEEFRIQRKPPGVQETLWRPVWPLPATEAERWSGWSLTGHVERADDGELRLGGNGAATLGSTIRDEYRHGYPAAIFYRIPVTGARASGRSAVGDLKLELRATAEAGAGPLHVHLDCGPFPLGLTLDPARGAARIQPPGGQPVEQALAFTPGEEVEVALAFWDHRVTARVEAGAGDLHFAADLDLEPQPVTANGVQLHAERGGWRLRPPRLYRDIHYLPPLNDTGPQVFEIPPGHYFMLGDNTQNSLDSRDWEARLITVRAPGGGARVLRGDHLQNGQDPFFDNPRWNASRTRLTLRDEFGNLFVVPASDILEDNRIPAHYVPREYILGKAMAVFLPIPPFAPVFRLKTIR